MKKYPVLMLVSGSFKEARDDGRSIRVYRSAEELLASEREAGSVIMETQLFHQGEEREYAENILALRRSAIFCYAPIFFTHSVSALDVLADGVSDDVGALARAGDMILNRGEQLRASSLEGSYKLRMLSYMYARGSDYELAPFCAPGSKCIYGYPLVAAIMNRDGGEPERYSGGSGTELHGAPLFNDDEMAVALKWIREAQLHGYIEHTRIYDRIRLCPKCQTGMLNYVDICPHCGSLDIAKKKMIHCFTCGYVAPEPEFRRGFTLSCPRCDSRLRHIGSDYDYPLESYQCGNCGSAFVEPDVRVSCLSCGTRSLPEELTVSNFYGYRLSDRGEEALRTGIIPEDFMLFSGASVVTMQSFCGIIKWLLELRRRYADEDFSLLRARLSGLSEAEELIGTAGLRAVISELDRRIRELVRETDITVLGEDGAFWLLLPRTPFNGGMILTERLEDMSSLFEGRGAEKLRLSVKCFSISADDASLPPDELLKKLAKEA
ncbi:MAG: hypothetical protein Q4D58_00980 [Synergistaceae bacterium]|nr:hypothetical protein [Synergistaceae bacterium]